MHTSHITSHEYMYVAAVQTVLSCLHWSFIFGLKVTTLDRFQCMCNITCDLSRGRECVLCMYTYYYHIHAHICTHKITTCTISALAG